MTAFDIDAAEAARAADEAALARVALEYQQYIAAAGVETELTKRPYDHVYGTPARFYLKGTNFRLTVASLDRISFYPTVNGIEYHMPYQAATPAERQAFIDQIKSELQRA